MGDIRYEPPQKTKVVKAVLEGARKTLIAGAREQMERFGLLEGEWVEGTLAVNGIKDMTVEYAEARDAGSIKLKREAHAIIAHELIRGRYTGRGYVGTYHTHYGGDIGIEPADVKLLELNPAGVMGIVYFTSYGGRQTGFELYHCAAEEGKRPVRIFKKEVPVRMPKDVLWWLEQGELMMDDWD